LTKDISFYQIRYAASNDADENNPYFLGQVTPSPEKKGEVFIQLNSLEFYLKDLRLKTFTFSSSPLAPLSGLNYVSLSINQAFQIPIASDLKQATFTCTDGSVRWNETDRPKIEGKTAAEAIAAGLTGKIVLIGDKSDTFRQLGTTSPGPYIFRTGMGAVEITKIGNVFEVLPVMLQPMVEPVQIPIGRTVYTSSSATLPQNNDLVIVDGSGNITLPSKPIDGFRFTLDDLKFRRLEENRNAVVPAVGDAIGLGQTSATIDHLSPLTWVTADKGSFSRWIYEAASKNWVVLLTREMAGTVITQSALRPTITTGNTDISAVTYDRFFLGGAGNILINGLTNQREFIDISWAPASNWIMKVICPVGFTIMGDFEDLEINTALTSVTHLQIALGVGNNFEVTG